MDISAISSVISAGRKGTRIPEELLGLPSRNARYERLSMEAIPPLTSVRTSRTTPAAVSAKTAETTNVTALTDVVQGLIGNTAGVTDPTFRNVLAEAVKAQTTKEDDGVSSLLSDPSYYRNLMMLSSLSSNLLSDSLSASGTSSFGVGALGI